MLDRIFNGSNTGISPMATKFIDVICNSGLNVNLCSDSGPSGKRVFQCFTPDEREDMEAWLSSWQNRGRRIRVFAYIVNRRIGANEPVLADVVGTFWLCIKVPHSALARA